MQPGQISVHDVGRRFRVNKHRNLTLKEAILRPRDAAHRGVLGAARRLVRCRAGRVDRLRRAERLRQDDAAAADRGHLRAHDRAARGRRHGRLAARARRRLPSGLHGPREHLPERLDLRAQAPLRRASGSRRSSRSPSSRASSTCRCARTRRGCTCGSGSRSRCTWTRTSCCSTRCSRSATRRSSASASGRSSTSRSAAGPSASSRTSRPRWSVSASARCCCAKGEVEYDGPASEAIARYHQSLALEENPGGASVRACASGGAARFAIGTCGCVGADGEPRAHFARGEPVTIGSQLVGERASTPPRALARGARRRRLAARRRSCRTSASSAGTARRASASCASCSRSCRSREGEFQLSVGA